MKIEKNTLFYGDNLDILRDKISDNLIDLIYLDPPFKSGKTYNIIFKPLASEIEGATAQIETFEDTWTWGPEAMKGYEGLISGNITKEKATQKLIDLMRAMMSYLGGCSMMAYLSMMAPRLLEMKRVLKDSGSIYLHCDPTASHYLKLLMDAIFGVENFRNEIIWHYRRWTAPAKKFQKLHDVILFYTKTKNYKFNRLLTSYTKGSIERKKGGVLHRFKKGEEPFLVSNKEIQKEGVPENDVWQIPFVAPSAKERIGYPTQKPEKLLERIIKASSKKGDLVLDPFCGCGTTIAVAERLRRNWIGIDITYIAIDVISKRLRKSGIKEGIDFEIHGEPKDVYSAKKLSEKDPFQFQIWCNSRLDATPSQTKTADKGVDGIIYFIDPSKSSKIGKGIIQVKGTENINPSMVRDLKGTLKSQNADFGILITFKNPTQGMINEATIAGYFKYANIKIPKIQFLTVEDLFKDPIPTKLPGAGAVFPAHRKPIIKKGKSEQLKIQ